MSVFSIFFLPQSGKVVTVSKETMKQMDKENRRKKEIFSSDKLNINELKTNTHFYDQITHESPEPIRCNVLCFTILISFCE